MEIKMTNGDGWSTLSPLGVGGFRLAVSLFTWRKVGGAWVPTELQEVTGGFVTSLKLLGKRGLCCR